LCRFGYVNGLVGKAKDFALYEVGFGGVCEAYFHRITHVIEDVSIALAGHKEAVTVLRDGVGYIVAVIVEDDKGIGFIVVLYVVAHEAVYE
jgi:hypothetical protein